MTEICCRVRSEDVTLVRQRWPESPEVTLVRQRRPESPEVTLVRQRRPESSDGTRKCRTSPTVENQNLNNLGRMHLLALRPVTFLLEIEIKL